MDPPLDQDQLYAKFGRTAEMAQLLEIDVGNVVLAIAVIPVKTAEITEEERACFRALVDDLNRKPLGQLLKCIRPLIAIDERVVSQIDTALERRNYLMHRFFRTHNFRIFSEEGREIMSRDLDEIYRSLSFARAPLCAFTLLLEKLAGREGKSEQIAEKGLAQGKRVEI